LKIHNKLTLLILSNVKPYQNNKPERRGNSIEKEQTHAVCVLVIFVLKAAEITKKKNVASAPTKKVSHEIGALTLGTNAPITTEPKIILEPSRKNSENVRKYASELILTI